MNKQDRNFLIAIAFILMATSAVALAHVMLKNQYKYQTKVEMTATNITDVPDTTEYHPTIEEIEDAILEDMALAFAIVESGNKVNAWNKKEDAVGCLQIRPVMVREANSIMGEEFFSYNDRWDRNMSFYIFEVVMRHHNYELDIDQACDVWNPNCPRSYRNAVKKAYAEVTAKSLERRGY